MYIARPITITQCMFFVIDLDDFSIMQIFHSDGAREMTMGTYVRIFILTGHLCMFSYEKLRKNFS